MNVVPTRTDSEVPVGTDSAPSPALQTSRVFYISKDPQGNYKAHGVSVDVDMVQLGPEK